MFFAASRRRWFRQPGKTAKTLPDHPEDAILGRFGMRIGRIPDQRSPEAPTHVD